MKIRNYLEQKNIKINIGRLGWHWKIGFFWLQLSRLIVGFQLLKFITIIQNYRKTVYCNLLILYHRQNPIYSALRLNINLSIIDIKGL